MNLKYQKTTIQWYYAVVRSLGLGACGEARVLGIGALGEGPRFMREVRLGLDVYIIIDLYIFLSTNQII